MAKFIVSEKELNVADWEFVGEGNQHLLIKCINCDSSLFGYLLRFNKHHSPEQSSNEKYDDLKQLDQILQRSCKQILYNQLERLKIYLLDTLEVDFSSCNLQFKMFVEQIELKIAPQRKREKLIDLNQKVEIIQNFNQDFSEKGSKLSGMIELKPKSPLEEKYTETQIIDALQLYSEEEKNLLNVKLNTASEQEKSRFFKIQLSKQQKNSESSTLSKYNPINLFSGNIKSELNNLLLTPMNNLSISLFKGEQHELIDSLVQIPVLREALNEVLNMINLFQICNENINQIFSDFIHRAKEFLQQPSQFFDKVFSDISNELTHNISSNMEFALKKDLEQAVQGNLYFLCKVVVKFLLSISFRDLSILINIFTASKQNEELQHNQFSTILRKFQSNVDQKVKEQVIHFNLAIIDCDLKPIHSYQKYMNLEKQNLSLFLKYLLQKND